MNVGCRTLNFSFIQLVLVKVECLHGIDCKGDAVVLRTSGSTPIQTLLCNNLRQVVHTLVPLSPSSISWYRCKNCEGNDRLCKKCGLRSITLSVSSLPRNRDECHTCTSQSCERAMLTTGLHCLYHVNMIVQINRRKIKDIKTTSSASHCRKCN